MSPCPCFRSILVCYPYSYRVCRVYIDHVKCEWRPLQEAGVPTPKFGLAKSAAEARKIAEDIATNDLVVKAQVSTWIDLSLTDFSL